MWPKDLPGGPPTFARDPSHRLPVFAAGLRPAQAFRSPKQSFPAGNQLLLVAEFKQSVWTEDSGLLMFGLGVAELGAWSCIGVTSPV